MLTYVTKKKVQKIANYLRRNLHAKISAYALGIFLLVQFYRDFYVSL